MRVLVDCGEWLECLWNRDAVLGCMEAGNSVGSEGRRLCEGEVLKEL